MESGSGEVDVVAFCDGRASLCRSSALQPSLACAVASERRTKRADQPTRQDPALDARFVALNRAIRASISIAYYQLHYKDHCHHLIEENNFPCRSIRQHSRAHSGTGTALCSSPGEAACASCDSRCLFQHPPGVCNNMHGSPCLQRTDHSLYLFLEIPELWTWHFWHILWYWQLFRTEGRLHARAGLQCMVAGGIELLAAQV